MTFQRKLLLGFSLMTLPALLIGAEAIRTNVLERRALKTLSENMARNRTYAELETAMFAESEIIWRYLTGMDATARHEFDLSAEVVGYWQTRWRAELRPRETALADSVDDIQRRIVTAATGVFGLYDSGKHELAYRTAQSQLRDDLFPALTRLNRDIYRRARESSVRGAYQRLEELVAYENRVLLAILVLGLGSAVVASWLIARSLGRPIGTLSQAMAVVGSGNLDYPIDVSSRDEIGDVARTFAGMTEKLRQSRTELVHVNNELAAKVSQLERTQAQLVHAERLASIGQMAAAVAHGIRNPLASLRAAAQMARRHADAPAARTHLASIIEEVDRLDRRVSHLLSFSRPAQSRPVPDRVERLVQEALPAFSQLLRDRQVELTVAVAPDVPEVRVDRMQVEQALVEVISNALDAMPDGGTLSIDARAESGADGKQGVSIEIADTGVGIPDDVLPSVGEVFFTTRPEGTGLGLATAKRFVEQNGGRLDLTSRHHVGTTVRIWLPATDGGENESADGTPPAASGAAVASQLAQRE